MQFLMLPSISIETKFISLSAVSTNNATQRTSLIVALRCVCYRRNATQRNNTQFLGTEMKNGFSSATEVAVVSVSFKKNVVKFYFGP